MLLLLATSCIPSLLRSSLGTTHSSQLSAAPRRAVFSSAQHAQFTDQCSAQFSLRVSQCLLSSLIAASGYFQPQPTTVSPEPHCPDITLTHTTTPFTNISDPYIHYLIYCLLYTKLFSSLLKINSSFHYHSPFNCFRARSYLVVF